MGNLSDLFSMKSRMKGDFHVRFCGNVKVKFLRVTRLGAICGQCSENKETNHRITMAFTQNRWLIMDITWDSDNEYKNGVFGNKSGMGRTYKYFDVTIPFLSFSHRLKEC